MAITDAEKQLRFRKKEALKREADAVFRRLQLGIGINTNRPPKTPQEIKFALDKAIELPSGWTDEDYVRAQQKVSQVFHDFFSMPDQLKIDVDEGTNSSSRFMSSQDPQAFLQEEKKALTNTRALAAHLVSALNLSSCSEAEKAAAVMEAVRAVGREVANQKEIPKSAATAICLAILGPHYSRPQWFVSRLGKALSSLLDNKLSNEIGQFLIDSNLPPHQRKGTMS